MSRSAWIGLLLIPSLACSHPSSAAREDAATASDAPAPCSSETGADGCPGPDTDAGAIDDDGADSWACGEAGAFGADADSGAVNWAMNLGKTGVISPGPVAIDSTTGEIAVVGTSPFGSAEFGDGSVNHDCQPTPLEAATTPSCVDLFVARFDACGHVRWAKMVGSGGTMSPLAVAVGPAGKTVVGGQLSPGANVNFGCGQVPAVGTAPFFVAAFDDAGSCVFSKGFGATGESPRQSLTSLAVDGAGNVLLAGEMTASAPIDFGGGPVGGSTFIAKLGPDGSHLWSSGLRAYSASPALAVDGKGEAIFAATIFPDPDANGVGDAEVAAHSELALIKYDPAGNELWSKLFEDAAERAHITGSGVAVNAQGNIALLGSFSGAPVDFGMGLLTPGATGAAIVVLLDPNGGTIWRKALQPMGAYLYPGSVAVDDDGGVTLTAGFAPSAPSATAGSIDFGGGSLPASSSAVAHFDSTGAYTWAYALQPSSSQGGGAWATLSGIAVARTTAVIAGGFGGSCPGTSICLTSPAGVTVTLPGKTVTAQSATDTFLASFGL